MAKTLDQILDQVFDSRDIIARRDELENEMNTESENAFDNEDDAEEYRMLTEFIEEAEGYSEDFAYGTTFIRDDYFEEYAEELADEMGVIDRDAEWPLNHIDWEAAADQLREDYTEIEINGNSYWYR